MNNPLHALTDIFHPGYRVNLSIERLDGSLTLTLSNAQGQVSKHLISPEQCRDPKQLQVLIEQVQRHLQQQPAREDERDLEQRQPGLVSGLPG